MPAAKNTTADDRSTDYTGLQSANEKPLIQLVETCSHSCSW